MLKIVKSECDLLVRLVNAQKAKATDRVETNVFNPIIDFNIAALKRKELSSKVFEFVIFLNQVKMRVTFATILAIRKVKKRTANSRSQWFAAFRCGSRFSKIKRSRTAICRSFFVLTNGQNSIKFLNWCFFIFKTIYLL